MTAPHQLISLNCDPSFANTLKQAACHADDGDGVYNRLHVTISAYQQTGDIFHVPNNATFKLELLDEPIVRIASHPMRKCTPHRSTSINHVTDKTRTQARP